MFINGKITADELERYCFEPLHLGRAREQMVHPILISLLEEGMCFSDVDRILGEGKLLLKLKEKIIEMDKFFDDELRKNLSTLNWPDLLE